MEYGTDYFDERYYLRGGLYENKVVEWRPRADWLVCTFKPKTALEIGSGEGCLLECFQRLRIEAYGIDLSRYGSHFFKWNRVWGSDVILPFRDGSFDFICGFDILEHNLEKDIPDLLRELARVTQAGGMGYFNVALVGQTDDKVDPTHYTLKPREWWERQFEPYFEVLQMDDYCPTLTFKDAQFTVRKRRESIL